MELKIKKLISDAIIPTRKRVDDAGLDLYSIETVVIHYGQVITIDTGIAIEIPHGFYGYICDRSGLASKGLHVLAGIVDSSYRGPIKIVLSCVSKYIKSYANNLEEFSYQINKGDRIAQLIISPYKIVDIIEVEELNNTDRGKQGFGSSGL